MLGWIAPIFVGVVERRRGRPGLAAVGGALEVDAPAVVLGARAGRGCRRSRAATGLFLIGPRMPSGSRRGFDHVRPPSVEVISMPHHSLGVGPTL